ncbi:hypothetical protein E4U48_006160 [Claviceps purpurea]|nr:hypothetical protein E4U48_006160 [Claviceps purpurea]
MAWIDDSRRQDEEAYESAEEEHAANNYSFRHRGLRGIMRKVQARAAAKQLEDEVDDEIVYVDHSGLATSGLSSCLKLVSIYGMSATESPSPAL